MLKKDTAKYIEALRQGLEKWRDYEEHRDKPVESGTECAVCSFIRDEWDRLGRRFPPCKYCFLYKKNLCEQKGGTSECPFWLMVVGDEQSPLYGELPDDEGRWDERRKDRRGLHYPLFRGVMRRAIEAELRRVSGMGRASPFSEEAAKP
jgi:hypothetical protein